MPALSGDVTRPRHGFRAAAIIAPDQVVKTTIEGGAGYVASDSCYAPGLFTGGAQCCYAMAVYRWQGGRYRGSFFNGATGGLTVVNLDRKGVPEIRSADGRFRYLFSSGAESFLPIRIYRFRRGKLVTVTREFRYHIRQAEIRSWQVAAELSRDDRNPHTALAAWAANKYLLGEGGEVWPELTELIDQGLIEPNVEGNGRPYLGALRRALREFGYFALPQQS